MPDKWSSEESEESHVFHIKSKLEMSRLSEEHI